MTIITKPCPACSKLFPGFLIVLLISAIVPSVSFAQKDTMPRPKPPINGWIPYLGLELTASDVTGLNSSLSEYGYPTFNESQVGFTGGFTSILHNFYMGLDFSSYIRKDGNSAQGHTVRLRTSQFMATPGYLLFQSNKSFIFLTAGVGTDYFEIEIQENSDIAFDSVLNNPHRTSTLTGTNPWLLRPGLTGIFFFGGEEGYKRNTGGFGLFAQAGYGFALGTAQWTLLDRQVVNGPNVSLAGPYVRLGLALGGISRSR